MIGTCNQVSPVETAAHIFLIKVDFTKLVKSNIDSRLLFLRLFYSAAVLYISFLFNNLILL